jgi:hypothetical protein
VPQSLVLVCVDSSRHLLPSSSFLLTVHPFRPSCVARGRQSDFLSDFAIPPLARRRRKPSRALSTWSRISTSSDAAFLRETYKHACQVHVHFSTPSPRGVCSSARLGFRLARVVTGTLLESLPFLARPRKPSFPYLVIHVHLSTLFPQSVCSRARLEFRLARVFTGTLLERLPFLCKA